MQLLKLKKNIPAYFVNAGKVITERDITYIPSALIPGEWVLYENPDHQLYLGFINTKTSRGVVGHLIDTVSGKSWEDKSEIDIAEKTISGNIQKAFLTRKKFYNERENYRLIYGFNDNLPGLVVDCYSNCVLVQIKTAGMDRFRGPIKSSLESIFDKTVILFDKAEAREVEGLPVYSNQDKIENILVNDDGFEYVLPFNIIQKNGYYFDHVENRRKLEMFLKRYTGNLTNGVDLFCYTGSWGMHLKRSLVENVTFVDQGDYQKIIQESYAKHFPGQSCEFVRKDVFSFLDDCQAQQRKFDVVVCDPPAFSKDIKNLESALKGYRKLYKKIFPTLTSQALLVVASCTYGVTFDDLARIVSETSIMYHKKVVILDIGMQGPDHSINNFSNKGSYLKYLLFYIEDN